MKNLFNSGLVSTMITATAITTTLVVTQVTAIAKSATEIAAIATATTVKIDNTLGIPGGSGVIIAKQNNTYTVLTANHVVLNPNVGYIVKIGKEEHTVTGVKSLNGEAELDLAIVTFTASEAYAVATFGDSAYATAGSNVKLHENMNLPQG